MAEPDSDTAAEAASKDGASVGSDGTAQQAAVPTEGGEAAAESEAHPS